MARLFRGATLRPRSPMFSMVHNTLGALHDGPLFIVYSQLAPQRAAALKLHDVDYKDGRALRLTASTIRRWNEDRLSARYTTGGCLTQARRLTRYKTGRGALKTRHLADDEGVLRGPGSSPGPRGACSLGLQTGAWLTIGITARHRGKDSRWEQTHSPQQLPTPATRESEHQSSLAGTCQSTRDDKTATHPS